MIDEDIEILEKIYENQDDSLHDEWDCLVRLAEANLAEVEVTYSNEEGTIFPSASADISNERVKKKDYDVIWKTEITKEGVELLANEKRHKTNTNVQRLLVTITSIYVFTVVIQVITSIVASYNNKLFGIADSTWYEILLIFTLLFGIFGYILLFHDDLKIDIGPEWSEIKRNLLKNN